MIIIIFYYIISDNGSDSSESDGGAPVYMVDKSGKKVSLCVSMCVCVRDVYNFCH